MSLLENAKKMHDNEALEQCGSNKDNMSTLPQPQTHTHNSEWSVVHLVLPLPADRCFMIACSGKGDLKANQLKGDCCSLNRHNIFKKEKVQNVLPLCTMGLLFSA